MSSPETFADLLNRLLKQFPSRRAFARAIGVDPSRLSRAMNGDPTMFDVLRCFYVARATKENPFVVLRAAGKGELADVIEELVGPAKSPEVLTIQRALDRVGPLLRHEWLHILADLAQAPPAPPARFPRKVVRKRHGAA